MVDDAQLALAGRRAAAARRSPKTRSSGVFMTIWVRVGGDAAPAQQVARLGGDEDVAVGEAALTRSSTRIRRTSGWFGGRSKRVANSSGKVSWKLSTIGVPRSFGRRAAKTSASGMLWISIRSKRSRRSRALTLRAAPARKRALPSR